MATQYLLRFTYTNEALRAMINDPQDRRASFAKLAEKLGYRVGDAYYSITKSQALIIIEGPPEELGVLEFTVRESGGFEGIEIEQIVTNEEVIEIFGRAKSLSTEFAAPNQDEIDRILLDE